MKYRIVQENITEEIIEVEADSEVQAIDLVADGHGELIDQTFWRPQVIGVEELEEPEEGINPMSLT
jgi:hypothetical protein